MELSPHPDLPADYLELLKHVLTDYLHVERGYDDRRRLYPEKTGGLKQKLINRLLKFLEKRKLYIYHVRSAKFDKADMQRKRTEGKDWPLHADTMIGLKKLHNFQYCIEQALKDDVPGDIVETGVWRGGASILARAVLKAYNVTDRKVWVADSFEGLPPPSGKYEADEGDGHHQVEELAIGLETVQENFEKYNLLDGQVEFLKGWFKDTLPSAPIDAVAVLRLDGDMYESTMDALLALYDKVPVGGFIIVDDYGAIPGCKQAIHDFRDERNITDEMKETDWSEVWWRKS